MLISADMFLGMADKPYILFMCVCVCGGGGGGGTLRAGAQPM